MDQGFLRDSIIAPLDFNNRKRSFLQDEYTLENIEIEERREKLRIQSYQQEILRVREQFLDQETELWTQLKQASLNFEAQLHAWEENYLLKAPISGMVSFFKPISEAQFVNAGDEIMTIVPHDDQILGYAYVSSNGFGKIKSGQSVKIRLDAFPYEEYGIVEGEVSNQSSIARDGQYLVKIKLLQGLATSYHKQLRFSQEMAGEAFIITEKLRLIERVFYQFKHIFSESF